MTKETIIKFIADVAAMRVAQDKYAKNQSMSARKEAILKQQSVDKQLTIFTNENWLKSPGGAHQGGMF
jgi:hypothetical protein